MKGTAFSFRALSLGLTWSPLQKNEEKWTHAIVEMFMNILQGNSQVHPFWFPGSESKGRWGLW